MATVAVEVKRILRAYKEGVLDEDQAVERIAGKFNMLHAERSIELQQRSLALTAQMVTDNETHLSVQNSLLERLVVAFEASHDDK